MTPPRLDGAESDDQVVVAYHRAQDGFDAVVAQVPADGWDAGSACASWSVRDVVAHVTWGQELVRHLAEGREHTDRTGAPGSEHPGAGVDADGLTGWRRAREAADRALDTGLDRLAPARYVERYPAARLVDFLTVLTLDLLAHTWDVAHPLGLPDRLDPDLVARSHTCAEEIVIRAPGLFDTPVEVPLGADQRRRWLAFLGRAAG